MDKAVTGTEIVCKSQKENSKNTPAENKAARICPIKEVGEYRGSVSVKRAKNKTEFTRKNGNIFSPIFK